MKKICIIFLCVFSCNKNVSNETENKIHDTNKTKIKEEPMSVLNLEQANRLADLPLACVGTEYPYRLGQTLGSDKDLKSPKELHPTFYGCFDFFPC